MKYRILICTALLAFAGCGILLHWASVHNWPSANEAPLQFFGSAVLAGVGTWSLVVFTMMKSYRPKP
jgi:hypothetical protein